MDSKEITQQKIIVNNKGKVSIIAANVDVFRADYTRIEGNFKISAEDLCRLIPMLDKNFAGWREEAPNGWYVPGGYIMTRDKAVDKLIEEKQDLMESLDEMNDKVEELYKRIRDKDDDIDEFKYMLAKFPKFILKIFLSKEELEKIKQSE